VAEKLRAVRSRHNRHNAVVHYAPVVPDQPWMVDRVTLCLPRGSSKAWFEDYGGTVTCARCLALASRGG